MAAGTLERLIANVSRALGKLEFSLQADNIVPYFEQLGARFPDTLATDPDVVGALGTVSSALGLLTTHLAEFDSADQEGGNDDVLVVVGLKLSAQVTAVLDAVTSLGNEISADPAAWSPLSQAEVLAFTSNLARRVLDDRLLNALEVSRQEFVSAAVLLGLVDRFEIPVAGAEPDSPPVFRRELRLDRLTDMIRGGDYFLDVAGWSTTTLDLPKFLARFESFLNVFSYNTVIDPTAVPPVLYAGAMTVELNDSVSPVGIDLVTAFSLPLGYSASIPVGEGYHVNITTSGSLDAGSRLTITPPTRIDIAHAANVRFVSELARTPISPQTSIVLFGQTGGTRLEIQRLALSTGFELRSSGAASSGEFFFEAKLEGGKGVVDFTNADGFLKSFVSGRVEADFHASARYGVESGLKFDGGAALELILPLNANFAGVKLNTLKLQLPLGESGRSGVPLDIALGLSVELGPVVVLVDGIGLKTDLTFDGGNLGFGNIALGFKPPTGAGISVDAGPVRGGGALFFESERYSGVLELSAFGIGLKAFGLIDTRLPDGTPGFSFVIVITAEFTPIQLGFGFTLLGVGGLIGINRTMNSDALGEVLRAGRLDHLLFPSDPVKDAPGLLNDLGNVFPAAKEHYVFGPMAKLGWGTPTLIEGKLGIVLEFPGPRLAVLGVVRCALPSQDAAIIQLNLAVLGILDFPASLFSLDASLYDSRVGQFAVSGDMAMRLNWGSQKNFALSVGGLNPSYQPPAGFPELRRAAIDLAGNGNPSLSASGYFAITSNTAQVGAALDLRAGGAGIQLKGHLGFDALFVFSPFSFTASIEAGVSVRFHGVGFGIHLHGQLSGPSPWHIKGRVCVSVLFWDACLSIDHKFGRADKVELPPLNPWEPENGVLGLRAALEDSRNWSGSLPNDGSMLVSLTDSITPLIDTLGSASVRQRVVPLHRKIVRFGEHRAAGSGRYELDSVVIGEGSTSATLTRNDTEAVMDRFAPAQFDEMDDADRLSAESYQPMEAGLTLKGAQTRSGSLDTKSVTYRTIVLFDQPASPPQAYALSAESLLKLLGASSSALFGPWTRGALKYLPPATQSTVVLQAERFVIVRRDTLQVQVDTTIGTAAQSRSSMGYVLESTIEVNAALAGLLQVVPQFETLGV